MNKTLGKLLTATLIFGLGIGTGILLEFIEDLFHQDFMTVTVWDSSDRCGVNKVIVYSGGYSIEKEIKMTKESVHFYARKRQITSYDITVHTENCGVIEGYGRTAYPGQVIYEFIKKGEIRMEIRS